MSTLSTLEQLSLTPRELATYRAEKAAETDYFAGLKPNSSRYTGAKPGSSWDTWYLRKYQELQNSN
jgi:hypothetical protein